MQVFRLLMRRLQRHWLFWIEKTDLHNLHEKQLLLTSLTAMVDLFTFEDGVTRDGDSDFSGVGFSLDGLDDFWASI